MATENEQKIWNKLDQIIENQNKQNVNNEKLTGQLDLIKLKIEAMEQTYALQKQSHDVRISKLEEDHQKLEEKLSSELKQVLDKIEPITKEIAKAQVIFAIIAAGTIAALGFIQQYVGK